MGRWEPDARGRLQQAALELYVARGFDRTTVAEIAERAGLTERTFFRYFADKREVLFGGSDVLQDKLVSALEATDPAQPPLDQVAAALVAADEFFSDHEHSKLRQDVIDAHAELRERELIKLASLAAVLADALRRRGVSDPAASLSAETGIAVFKLAFERWVGATDGSGFGAHVRQALRDLRAVLAR